MLIQSLSYSRRSSLNAIFYDILKNCESVIEVLLNVLGNSFKLSLFLFAVCQSLGIEKIIKLILVCNTFEEGLKEVNKLFHFKNHIS